MLVSDLSLTLMIMINALVFNQSSATKALVQRGRASFPSPVSFRDRSDYFQPTTTRARSRRGRNGHRRNWYLDPIITKLKNVIDNYELKRAELKALYPGVVACGLTGCEKFRDLIPDNQNLKKFKCLGNQRILKKKILKLLSQFHEGIQKVEESFQSLIEFEKLPHLNNGSRRKILEEFKTNIRTLNVEIETVMTNKRLNIERRSSNLVSPLLSEPKYRTHLMIYEWRIIRDSKRFLQEWKKNLQKIFKCWKKRKRQEMFVRPRSNRLGGRPKKGRHSDK